MTRLLLPLAMAMALSLSACSRPPVTALEPGEAPPRAIDVWPAPRNVAERVAAAELIPFMKDAEAVHAEALQTHIHAHLEVYRRGKQVIVPNGIGLGSGITSPVHTHDPSGVIHVEAPAGAPVRLWQFFALWDVPLDGAKVVADGQVVSDPRSLEIRNNQLITVEF